MTILIDLGNGQALTIPIRGNDIRLRVVAEPILLVNPNYRFNPVIPEDRAATFKSVREYELDVSGGYRADLDFA